MRKLLLFISALVISLISFSQTPTLAIIEIKSNGLNLDNKSATNIFRFEIEKSKNYQLMEEEDMKYKFVMQKHNIDDCFNPICLIDAGVILEVDKVISGSVSKFGDNTLVVVKTYDIVTKKLETSKKIEVVKGKDQTINEAISAAIKEYHSNEENFITIDINETKKEEVIEEKKEEPTTSQVKYYNYSDPQVYNEGLKNYLETREKESRFPKLVVTTRPTTLFEPFTKVNLGVQYSFDDATAIKASYGYLFESTQNNVWTVNGDEPGITSGFELRGELLLRLPKEYFNYETYYSRTYISFEGGYKYKYHQGYTAYFYDPNVGNLEYDLPGITSRVIMGNIKAGLQYIFSNRIYLDGYVGAGARIYRYNEGDGYYNNYNYYYLQNRILPNFTAGFDFGVIIK